MKKKILNNWALKLLSVAMALAIWVIVVNYDNPYTTRTISGIPIEIVNEDTITENNMVYTVVSGQTATVRVRAPRKVIQSLTVSDFKAVADFDNLYSLTNQIPITITCSNTSVSSDEITQITQSLEVDLENVLSKKMDVHVAVNGTPQDGYQVGEVSCSPSTVTVRAPQSFLDQINYVGVEVDVDGTSQNVNCTESLQFYNAGGNVMDSSNVQELSVTVSDIDVEVEILNVKEVSISYTITGQDKVADGYQYAGIELSPSSVQISGRRSALADVSSLIIPEGALDVTGASENIEKEFDLRDLLPEGVSLVDEENYTLKATLKIEKMSTREFTFGLDEIELKNLDSSLYLQDSDAEVTVKIQGLDSDLNALSESELNASLDLEGLEAGTYTLKVAVSTPTGFRVVNSPRVKVVLVSHKSSSKKTTTAAETSEDTEEETTTAEEETDTEEKTTEEEN